MPQAAVIHYFRPGKGETIYTEDFVADDGQRVDTFKTLPEDISLRLTDSLYKDGLIPQGVRVHTIVKTYFYDEPFNLLIFRDTEGNLLGHYSDIGEPVKKLGEGEYAMLDLFLDIWLMPDGTLLELDWDEFAEAVEQNLVTPAQAELARATLERLKIEIASGIYPRRYLLPG